MMTDSPKDEAQRWAGKVEQPIAAFNSALHEFGRASSGTDLPRWKRSVDRLADTLHDFEALAALHPHPNPVAGVQFAQAFAKYRQVVRICRSGDVGTLESTLGSAGTAMQAAYDEMLVAVGETPLGSD